GCPVLSLHLTDGASTSQQNGRSERSMFVSEMAGQKSACARLDGTHFRKHKALHRLRESFGFVRLRDKRRLFLYFRRRVSHCDTDAALLEHINVRGHVANADDLLRGNI